MEISKKMAFLSAGALLVAFGCFCFVCLGDVSDIGKRADDTRAGLASASEEQREQAAALDRAESAADRSQSAVDVKKCDKIGVFFDLIKFHK